MEITSVGGTPRRLTSERNDAGGLGVAGVVGSVLDEASFDSSLIFLIELLHQEQT